MRSRQDSGGLVWGVVLLVVGVVFLLNNFGYLPVGLWDQWWPLLLIAVGVVLLLRRSTSSGLEIPSGSTLQGPQPSSAPLPARPGGRRRSHTGGIILIGLGLAFLLRGELGDRAFPALVLIVVGLAVLLGGWW